MFLPFDKSVKSFWQEKHTSIFQRVLFQPQKKWCIGTPYIPYHPFSTPWKVQVAFYAPKKPWDDFPKQPKGSQGSSPGATNTGVAHTEASTHRGLSEVDNFQSRTQPAIHHPIQDGAP